MKLNASSNLHQLLQGVLSLYILLSTGDNRELYKRVCKFDFNRRYLLTPKSLILFYISKNENILKRISRCAFGKKNIPAVNTGIRHLGYWFHDVN